MSLQLSGTFDTSQLPRIAPEPVTITVARTVAPDLPDPDPRAVPPATFDAAVGSARAALREIAAQETGSA